MFARLLVPTDFSAASDAALEYARTFARVFGGTLHVMHVLPNVFLRPVVGDPHALEAAARAQLRDRFTGEDRARLHVVSAVERSDEPADEILSYARLNAIDLIVMGTHGRSGVAHLLLGSVAEKVVRSASCPVLTVRAALPGAAAGFRRILVPSNFSKPPKAAVECARLIGERFGAPVHQMRVAGDLARTIVRHAADNDFDLIVMWTHGRTGIAHLLMGSVAEAVVRSAECPVITVHTGRRRATDRIPEAEAVGATA